MAKYGSENGGSCWRNIEMAASAQHGGISAAGISNGVKISSAARQRNVIISAAT